MAQGMGEGSRSIRHQARRGENAPGWRPATIHGHIGSSRGSQHTPLEDWNARQRITNQRDRQILAGDRILRVDHEAATEAMW